MEARCPRRLRDTKRPASAQSFTIIPFLVYCKVLLSPSIQHQNVRLNSCHLQLWRKTLIPSGAYLPVWYVTPHLIYTNLSKTLVSGFSVALVLCFSAPTVASSHDLCSERGVIDDMLRLSPPPEPHSPSAMPLLAASSVDLARSSISIAVGAECGLWWPVRPGSVVEL